MKWRLTLAGVLTLQVVYAGSAAADPDGPSLLAPPRITGMRVRNVQKVQPPVSVPGVSTINAYGGLASLADEHSSIFSPGALPGHARDYLFFVASKTTLNASTSGLVVLRSEGPNGQGIWTLDFAADFDQSPLPPVPDGSTNGQIFIAPVVRDDCPPLDGSHPQDRTFDLNYANPGSVFLDPTQRGSDRVMMVYEGTTLCLNINGRQTTNKADKFYSTLGVATSTGFGRSWPAYRSDFTPLPGQSATTATSPAVGPAAPATGSFGDLVCVGNDCTRAPRRDYGRYPVVSPPYCALRLHGPELPMPLHDRRMPDLAAHRDRHDHRGACASERRRTAGLREVVQQRLERGRDQRLRKCRLPAHGRSDGGRLRSVPGREPGAGRRIDQLRRADAPIPVALRVQVADAALGQSGRSAAEGAAGQCALRRRMVLRDPGRDPLRPVAPGSMEQAARGRRLVGLARHERQRARQRRLGLRRLVPEPDVAGPGTGAPVEYRLRLLDGRMHGHERGSLALLHLADLRSDRREMRVAHCSGAEVARPPWRGSR
jgi:hypothetical protein